MPEEIAQSELTNEQIDNLVDQAERSTNQEIPMAAADGTAHTDGAKAQVGASTTVSPQPGAAAAAQMYEFVHNGKQIKAPVDQILKWAAQGYDYPQKMGKFNQDKQAWEAQRTQAEQKYAVYQQIDSWAEKNPDKWKAIETAYKQGLAPPNNDDPYAPRFQQLEGTLGKISTFMQQLADERSAAQAKLADDTLSNEIKSIREQYKDLDFDSLDDNGKSLEIRVLEHAKKLGISAFGPAFRDLCHDQLIARAQSSASQNVARGIQNRTRLGVLDSKGPTPKKGLTEVKDPRNKSYDELAREGLEEVRALQA